jgi:DNA-binding CsgD family transcriptional regulator
MAGSDEGAFLDKVYGAAVRPELWVGVMETFADMIGGSCGWLSCLDQTDGSGSGVTSRIDPAMAPVYEAHYARLNPFVDRDPHTICAWRPRIRVDEEVMAKPDLLRTEYFNDFLAPQAIHSMLMISLTQIGSRRSVLNITRPPDRGQFDGGDLEVAARFHGHLIRAMELGERLAADRRLGEGPAALFDRSTRGLFHLDRSARILRVNAAGEAVLRGDCGLATVGGRLVAHAPDVGRRLGALIAAAAAADPQARAGGSMALPSSGRILPLSVIVAPLGGQDPPIFPGEPGVLVCVTDLEADVSLSERTLRDLFGLTRAEARLAIALKDGATPREAAAALGISSHTAHIHLTHIFEKTGVNRQSALLRVMALLDGLAPD